MLFEEIYEEYKIYAQKRHKKQGFITLSYDFKRFVLPYFKEQKVCEITKLDIMNWQNEILNFNFKNGYNSKIYYCFNDFMKYCKCCSYIENNIVLEIGSFPKKIEIQQHTVYTIRQFRKFRRNIDNYIIKQYFNFMYFYGTRPSEAMGLRFCDYKKNNYLCVIHNLQRKGKRELDTPKNKSSIRVIKINLLMKFRIFQLKKLYLKKYGFCENDYFIFGGPKPLAPTTIDRIKKKAYTNAKLPNITQHEFRHSCATRKVHKKVPIDEVSRLLGHSKVSTTVDVYVHQEKSILNMLSQ